MGALDDGHIPEDLDNEGSGSERNFTREIEDAVLVLLQGLGEDCDREGLRRTPLRVAKALRDGTRGYKQKVKDIVQGALFPEAGLENGTGYAGGVGGLVTVRNINLFSYCESCLLPFGLQCHVGYVPSGQQVVGLSKLSRVADVFARRLQEPQRLADEFCSALHNNIKPAGVAVVLQCSHIQCPEALMHNTVTEHHAKLGMQGWIRASVCSISGVFKDETECFWDDFLALLKFDSINMDGINTQYSSIQSWCPFRFIDVSLCNGHSSRSPANGRVSTKSRATQASMIGAVNLIIQSLGEDPLRKELMGTPSRFVHWLTNFKRSNLEIKLNGFQLSKNGLHVKTLNGNASEALNEIHSELNLPFCSQCEHHLLPFHGVVHIGYFGSAKGEVIERSDLQSLVHFYGFKLQVQERLTKQIAEVVYSTLGTGVMVVVEASHICMISRGIEKVGCSTATVAVLGQFSTDPKSKATFLQIISDNITTRG